MHEGSVAFLAWAARYDDAGLEQRSLRTHEAWLARLPCPVLRLDGTLPTAEQVTRIITWSPPEQPPAR